MKYSNIFLHPWDDSHRLWQAFWLLFVLGNTLGVLIISTAVMMPLAPLGLSQTGFLFTSLLNIAMPIVTGISVFKCAKNSSHPIWGLLACNVVVLWAIWVCYITFFAGVT
jgi:hypothetical protein